ncbi:unnamed protein product [Rotaria sp. Silwood2]|nr:unnamed protein product [Rotaria sp. Silwood2]
MLLESNHINILLSFIRSISKSNDPDQLLSYNKRASILLNLLLKQVRDHIQLDHRLRIDQRLENIIISLAYLAVELTDACKIRAEIVQVLIDFYEKIPTAKYYETASFNYKHTLPPAEVFGFCIHTALTELASTSEDLQMRDKIMSLVADIIRQIVESLRKAAHEHSKERYRSIYRFEVPFLFGTLRSIGRISITDQSLMSQLFPINFISSTQSTYIEQIESINTSTSNIKTPTIVFRPIIPKVLTKNVLSSTIDNLQNLLHSNTNLILSTNDQQDSSTSYNHLISIYRSLSSVDSNDLPMFDDDFPANYLFFSVSGSTYRRQMNSSSYINSDRFRVCLTVPILEYLHETLKLIDNRVVKYLDKVALIEYDSMNRTNMCTKSSKLPIRHFPYTYFGDILILCIIKLFRDNLELLARFNERLSSITKSTYLFVQQLIALKLLDLDNDEYEKNSHRYRTRVDANAAALELLCLSCDDEIEAEKLCTKCAEKFSQESLSIKLLAAQIPLLVTSLEVLSRLAEKHKSLAIYTIRALCDFLTEPSPVLYKLYRHTSLKIDGQERAFFFNEQAKSSKEYRAFQIFEKLRDAAIEGLCKSLFIRLDSDPKCVEALLVQLSARLASGHVNDNSHWVFNIVLLDAAVPKRRSSIRDGVNKEKYESLFLGVLIPVIAVVMRRISVIVEPSERVFRLFQHFWFYCVLFGFADSESGLWTPEWHDCVRLIATKSPTLVVQNGPYVPLKSAMPLKPEQIAKEDNTELKSQLNNIFSAYPSAKPFIDRFGFEQSAYTLSVYYLETFRVCHSLVPSAFQCIFSYLEDPEENEHELRFTAIGAIPNGTSIQKENALDRDMVHAMTWLPIKMFTTSVMEGAVDCWCWAIIGRPELELLIVEEIYKVWEKIISDRHGLYSIDKPEPSPLAPSEKEELKPKPPSVNPHRIFLKFIEERVFLCMHKADIEMEMLVDLLHKSLSLILENPKAPMTKHIGAVGLRFRFLYLALYLVQSDYISDGVSKFLLREKIYHTAFDYFTVHHHCPTQTHNELRSDIRTLIRFFSLVHGEKKFCNDSPATIDSSNSMQNGLSNEATDAASLYGTTRGGATTGWINALAGSTAGAVQGVSGQSTLSRKSGTSAKNTDKSNDVRILSRDLLKKRNLLLTLLAYEIERLETFHNPLGRTELQFDQDTQSTYTNWKLYDMNGITNKAWQEYGRLAWFISPDLAISLYFTIPKESLRLEIQRLVKSYPLQVRHIPEALSIFTLTSDNDRQCETTHILTWASINPVAALSYFASARLNQVANSYTIQFASRMLYTTKSEALILYIPQLVQAVRYDEMGFVRRLILALSKKSNLLAHQLIWNIRTNTYKNEDTPDNEMQAKLEPIARQIEIDFTYDARNFYERVFTFSDRLTKVSDTIKSYPKGNSRKEACLQELRSIGSEVPPGVYLPSNPEATVISLIPESGAPMQSAAKAPYRATFRVQTVGIEQVEHCADPDYELMQDFSNQYSQMAIFKVGDDVRQDILALQLMRLFQNIFEQEGLELYLYTYRVIATSPGCGVIECVPNSRSREDIGRNTEVGLFEYFRHARRNFVMSMAAYSIALFMLQIKDRHNGNIMIDDEGHIIHIDFGFMFESSPGGNMRFEPDIKLTAEMILIMGDLTAPAFQWFKELCIKGYLALRPYRHHFVTLVALMLDTGLPCFRGHTLEQLNARLKPDSSEAEAARYMHEVINRCAHSLRTRLYDYIQYQQNSIPY